VGLLARVVVDQRVEVAADHVAVLVLGGFDHEAVAEVVLRGVRPDGVEVAANDHAVAVELDTVAVDARAVAERLDQDPRPGVLLDVGLNDRVRALGDEDAGALIPLDDDRLRGPRRDLHDEAVAVLVDAREANADLRRVGRVLRLRAVLHPDPLAGEVHADAVLVGDDLIDDRLRRADPQAGDDVTPHRRLDDPELLVVALLGILDADAPVLDRLEVLDLNVGDAG